MWRVLRTGIYCLLWYGSIVSGFYLATLPFLPLMLISPSLFREYGDRIFSFWEIYASALLDFFGVKIVVSGDHIHPNDCAILMMNHRTRLDWNFTWAAMYQACMPNIAAHKLKFILKNAIRHIPGPGWTMQLSAYLFITRHWENDKSRLSRSLDYFLSLKKNVQLFIFPEGTDLTTSSKKRSDEYAKKHELPVYKYVLHPKTTGFSYLAQQLLNAKSLDAIYDMTVAYPDVVPQSEVDLLKGKMPREVHFLIEKIPLESVPQDEENLRKWLEKRWERKEKILEKFYERKRFHEEPWPGPKRIPMQVAFIFWFGLSVTSLILFLTSPIFRIWTFVTSVIFLAFSKFKINFHDLEINWYWKWMSLKTIAKLK